MCNVPVYEYGVDGDGQLHENIVILGLFTAKQLESFPASESFGCTFSFEFNGNGSPIDESKLSKQLFKS